MALPFSIIRVALLLTFAASELSADATFTHHWTFDGTLNDGIGTQALTVNAGPTYAAGLLGQALHVTHCSTPAFCFSDTAAYTGNVIAPGPDGSFTLSCWFKFWAAPGDGAVCGYGQYGATGRDLAIYTESATSRVFFDYFNSNSVWSLGFNPLDGNWHNVIASYDGTNHVVSAYADGKFLGTDNKTLVFHDATPYAIGIGARDTVLVDSINADLDDVYFGTGVVTSQQVQNIWNGGNGGTPLGTGTIQVTSNLSNTTFSIKPSISGAPTGGPYPVTINNVPPGTYTVTFTPLVGYVTPTLPSQMLTAGSTMLFDGEYVPIVPPPSITSILPTSGYQGQTITNFTVNGMNFVPPLAPVQVLLFAAGNSFGSSGITVNSYSINVMGTQIVASISIAPTAATGPKDVIVTNRDGQQARLSGPFQVNKPRPVIVIPGTLGSTLIKADDKSLLWLNALRLISGPSCDEFLLPLALNIDGITPANPFQFTCPVFPRLTLNFAGIYAIPDQLFQGQTSANPIPALVPDFYSNLEISLASANLQVSLFPYDWRKDFAFNAGLLRSLVLSLTPNPGDAVDLIAHSQGGLIARAYYDLNKADHRINTVVYLGTPHLGTPKGYGILEGEMSLGIQFLNDTTAWFVSSNFPALYELAPRYNFMCLGSLYGCLNGTSPAEAFRTTYGLTSQQPANGYLPNTLLGGTLAQQADQLWNTHLQQTIVPIRSFAINGSGQNTVGRLSRDPRHDCVVLINDPKGDGTVPYSSASALGGPMYFYVNAQHADLPNNPVVDEKVIDILQGVTPTVIPGLFTIAPFTASGPVVIGNTCSPVTIQLFNNVGQMTGLDSNGSLRQDIPNSLFARFNTNESFILPATGNYRAALQATGNGTFSLSLNLVSEQQVALFAVEFKDIPISIHSRAEIIINPATLTQTLQLDVNGDGTVVYAVQSNQPPPVASFVSALVNAIMSFALPHGLTTDLTSVLQAALDSLQRGNNRAARHQLEAFEHKVAERVEKGLTVAQASTLTAMADKALALINEKDVN